MRNRRQQQRNNLRSARRNASIVDLNRLVFLYDYTIDYSSHPLVCIGQMNVVCGHCGAFKFVGELPGLCCLNGKVELQLLISLPEPLHSLLRGETQESHFLALLLIKDMCYHMSGILLVSLGMPAVV